MPLFWPTGDEGSMPADIATLLKTSMGLWNTIVNSWLMRKYQLGALKDIYIMMTMGFMNISNFL